MRSVADEGRGPATASATTGAFEGTLAFARGDRTAPPLNPITSTCPGQ